MRIGDPRVKFPVFPHSKEIRRRGRHPKMVSTRRQVLTMTSAETAHSPVAHNEQIPATNARGNILTVKSPLPSQAVLLAQLSTLAYEDEEKARMGAPEGAFTFLDKQGTQALVIRSEAHSFLAFRGTEPGVLEDILTDARIATRRTEDGRRIHVGFLGALEPLVEDIETALGDRDTPVYATGHSLGGALAVLWASMQPASRIASVCTFGAPAVGNGKFSAAYNEIHGNRTLLFQNKADFIPRLLKAPMWHHAGRRIWFDTRETLVENPGFWRRQLGDWRNTWRPSSSRTHLGDHAKTEYVRLLQQLPPEHPLLGPSWTRALHRPASS